MNSATQLDINMHTTKYIEVNIESDLRGPTIFLKDKRNEQILE